MTPYLNNKWTLGQLYFDVMPVPKEYETANGILPMPLTLNQAIGSEIALLLIERTPFVEDLAEIKPFQLFIKSGLATTSNGPLMFLLFYVPDPARPGCFHTAIDYHINPLDKEQLDLWRELSVQTHWHVFLVGEADKIAGFYELENTYGLYDVLDQAVEACAGMPAGNFDLAKSEFCAKFTIDDIYAS